MKRHTVNERELDAWLCIARWQEFAGSYGQGSDKSFEVDATNGDLVFKVTDRGETVFLGTDRQAAIAAYNKAP